MARTICLRQLTTAPRTRAQLAAVLAERQVPATAAERVLDRLAEVGLVDDEAYAEAWVRSRHVGRGLSRRALATELRHRGVEDEVVGAALNVVDTEAERATALRLARNKLRATRGLDTSARVRRAASVLARKGYPPGLALAVVREALAAEAGDAALAAEAGEAATPILDGALEPEE